MIELDSFFKSILARDKIHKTALPKKGGYQNATRKSKNNAYAVCIRAKRN